MVNLVNEPTGRHVGHADAGGVAVALRREVAYKDAANVRVNALAIAQIAVVTMPAPAGYVGVHAAAAAA